MRLTAYTPSSFLNHAYHDSSQPTIQDVIEYNYISSFRKYRFKYIESLESLFSSELISASTYRSLLNDCNKLHISFICSGEARAFFFFWPNGEVKILQTFGSIAIVDSLFWLQFYPFLRVIHFDRNVSCDIEVDLNQFDVINSISSTSLPFFIPSHNNHFGHFLLDDLPKLGISVDSLFGSSKTSLFPFSWRKSIYDIVASFSLLSPSLASVPSTSFSVSSSLVQPCVTSNLLRGFLQKKVISRIRRYHTNKSIPIYSHVFITRSGGNETRISNYSSLVNLLSSYNFFFLDVSDFSEFDVLSILSNATICVCEPGSATLLAQSYTQEFCKIVSILPKRFVFSPDSSMIESGLCYHFVVPSRTIYCLSESVFLSSIQTSDIIKCNIDHLRYLLETLSS
tara:strand:+ start:18515 stop:19705 length:1191 start_codon:yes stop_codon:yes gene_type:complete